MDENKLDRTEAASDDVSGVETLSVEAEPAADSTISVRSLWEKPLTPALVLGVVAVWGLLSWLYAEFTSYVVSAVIGLIILAWLVGFFVQPRRRWLARGLVVAVVGVLVAVPVAVDYQVTRQGDVVHARFGPERISMLPDGVDQLRLTSSNRMVGVNSDGSVAWTWVGENFETVWPLGNDLLLVRQLSTGLSVVGADDGVTRWAIDSDPIVIAASDSVVVVETGWDPGVFTGLSIVDGHQVWQTVDNYTPARFLPPTWSLAGVNFDLPTRFTTIQRGGATQVHDASTGEVTAVYPAGVEVYLADDSVFALFPDQGDCVVKQIGAQTPRTKKVDPFLCSDPSLWYQLDGYYLVTEYFGQVLDLKTFTSRPLDEDEGFKDLAQTTIVTHDSARLTFRDRVSGEELWNIAAPPPVDSRVDIQGDRVLVAVDDDGTSGRFFSAQNRDRLKVYDARTGELLASVYITEFSNSYTTDGWLLYQVPDEDNYRMLPLAK